MCVCECVCVCNIAESWLVWSLAYTCTKSLGARLVCYTALGRQVQLACFSSFGHIFTNGITLTNVGAHLKRKL